VLKGVIRVGVREHRAYTKEDLADGKSRRPLCLQNIKAYNTCTIDIRMIDLSDEINGGRFEWIIERKEDP
jgi:hypothetical protein